MELDEHLFRREAGRLVAALTRIFGIQNLALAEDVVQDAFCRALEVWKVRGVPDNPAAWLMSVAKHRAVDAVRREHTARRVAPELARVLESEWTLVPTIEEAFSGTAIRDEQLRMMFSCCDPRLPEDSQIALVLNILCGFGAGEIASAFLITQAAAEKRISRGKRVLAQSSRLFELTDADFTGRLSAVTRTLYLLFNEGYHGASPQGAVRVELCEEAIRLTHLLDEYHPAATSDTRALLALMYLQAARLRSRVDGQGGLTSLFEQDRAGWDRHLIARGIEYLNRSAAGTVISPYHLEAAIAAAHAVAPSIETTDWHQIVSLYDRLFALSPSPVVALNRSIAIGQRDGAARGLEALQGIESRGRLQRYPFYAAAMGEMQLRLGRVDAARRLFRQAAALGRNAAERRYLERRARDCDASATDEQFDNNASGL
jgi:RNA polymerase sigma-70 factor (ECF subfamily)